MLITSPHETTVHINSLTIKRMGTGPEGGGSERVYEYKCLISSPLRLYQKQKKCGMFVQVCYFLREAGRSENVSQASTEGLFLLVVKSRLLSLHQRELERIIFVKPGGTKGAGRKLGR